MVHQRRNRSWWQSAVRKWRASGLTAKEFGAAQNVHPSTLKWWSGQLRNQEVVGTTELSLVRVEIAPASHEAATLTAVVGPAELRIAVGTDADYVGAVVAAIARAAGRC